jgi:hypothetical protein
MYKIIICFIIIVTFSVDAKNILLPVSYDSLLIDLVSLDNIEIKTTPIPNIDSLITWENRINQEIENLPELYGFSYPVDYSLEDTGTWDTLIGGDRIWRLRIICPSALSINMVFKELKIHLYRCLM